LMPSLMPHRFFRNPLLAKLRTLAPQPRGWGGAQPHDRRCCGQARGSRWTPPPRSRQVNITGADQATMRSFSSATLFAACARIASPFPL
jgi:hypothetical protein